MSLALASSPAIPADETLAGLASLRVVVGYHCRFRCAFCYQDHRDGAALAPADLHALLGALPPAFSPRFVTLMGGEPTESPHLPSLVRQLREAYPAAVLSLTTNGSGALSQYRDLQRRGLDNVTVSLQTLDAARYAAITRQRVTTLDDVRTTLLELRRHGAVRVNAYLFPDQAPRVYRFCKEHGLSLTFCEDLRPGRPAVALPDVLPAGLSLVFENDIRRIYRDADGYEVWNYKHLDRFDYDNLVVLPDGSLTLDFADILAQRGR